MAAPIMTSCDMRFVPDWTRERLLKRHIIAIDQDRMGKQER
jgi:hypothetical protein